jgi:hypothetical protein
MVFGLRPNRYPSPAFRQGLLAEIKVTSGMPISPSRDRQREWEYGSGLTRTGWVNTRARPRAVMETFNGYSNAFFRQDEH